MRKVLKLLFYGAIVVSFLYSGETTAQDCKTSLVLENVRYIGKSIGPGGQNIDQFSVSWGVRMPCGVSTGKANVKLKIKRLTQEETAFADNIDSFRATGNLINLTIPRGNLATDPKSWSVTIHHHSTASSTRGVRISGFGIPSLATATIGPIPGIVQECRSPKLLQAKASKNPGVLQSVWKPNSSPFLSLLQVQVTRPSGGADLRCAHGSITPTALIHNPANASAGEFLRVEWATVPPSCEQIISQSFVLEVLKQDGTKIGPRTTAFAPQILNVNSPLDSFTSPIKTYRVDLSFKTQIDPAHGGFVVLDLSGTF